MNLLWVAAIAAFVLIEKVVPAGQWVSRAAGFMLTIAGVWLIVGALV
jgi:predicted metal-binding membrane protein